MPRDPSDSHHSNLFSFCFVLRSNKQILAKKVPKLQDLLHPIIIYHCELYLTQNLTWQSEVQKHNSAQLPLYNHDCCETVRKLPYFRKSQR